jgi:hypothetical protein
MKKENFCSKLSACFKRHVAFRKADVPLLCSEKFDSFFKLVLLHPKQAKLLLSIDE